MVSFCIAWPRCLDRLFREDHPRGQLAGYELVTRRDLPQSHVQASPTPSRQHLHLLPPRMLVSEAGAFSQPSLPCSAWCSQLRTRFPMLFIHSSVWAAHGDIDHKMESGVHCLTVKSVRYWIYMVFAEHIRRSSSSCLLKTAIIIQAVILSHWCFWKTI